MNYVAIFQGIVIVAQLFNWQWIQRTETLRGAMKIGRTHKANGDPITDCRSEFKVERSKSIYHSQNVKYSKK
jgi:hypothetical protein